MNTRSLGVKEERNYLNKAFIGIGVLRRTSRIAVVLLGLMAACSNLAFASQVSGAVDSISPLQKISQVRNLTLDQAKQGLRVHLNAIVTYFDSTEPDMFIQDSTGGIWVDVSGTKLTAEPGQQLDLVGITSAPDFAPQVSKPEWRVIGRAELPHAKRVPFWQLASTQEDGQRVQAEGVVHSIGVGGDHGGLLAIKIAMGDDSFNAL